MIKFLFVFLLIFLQSTFAFSQDSSAILEKIDYLTKNDMLSEAIQLFPSAMDGGDHEKVLRKWNKFNLEMIDKIKPKNICLHSWEPCSKCKDISVKNLKKYIDDHPKLSGFSAVVGFAFPFHIATGAYFDVKRYGQIAYELENEIPVISVDEAKVILLRYDELSKSVVDCLKSARSFMLTCANNKTEEFAKLYSDALSNFKIFKQNKINFISYDLISPYIQKTRQKLFICENYNILKLGHSQVILRDAAIALKEGAPKDLLLQSRQDVRRVFLDVFREFKQIAGGAEIEELKVVQSVVDDVSKYKDIGSEDLGN